MNGIEAIKNEYKGKFFRTPMREPKLTAELGQNRYFYIYDVIDNQDDDGIYGLVTICFYSKLDKKQRSYTTFIEDTYSIWDFWDAEEITQDDFFKHLLLYGNKNTLEEYRKFNNIQDEDYYWCDD